MKPEAQRIAIGTAVGYRNITPCPCGAGWLRGIAPDGREVTHIHDWLADLNAMHEAEKVLDVNTDSGDSPRYAYSGHVYNLVTSQSDGEQQPFRATAAQRSEAFLRALNLWTDDPPAAEVEGKR